MFELNSMCNIAVNLLGRKVHVFELNSMCNRTACDFVGSTGTST